MKTFIAALTLMSSSAVFAWGNTGHRVVGEVATRFLEIEVRVKAHKILKGESLARVSTWPDEIKSEPTTYSHTFNWHYTTWQTDDHDHSEHEESASTGLLLKSINDQTAVLRDPKASDEQKAFALRFLVHLIGDIHQPLHVGNGTDQGGNWCKVTFHKKAYNLHALWDEGMIDFTNLSYTELAKFVSEGRTIEEIKLARTGTVVDWARESKEIVPTLYPANVVQPPEPMSTRTYCQKEVKPEEMPKLAYEYSYRFMPIIEKRLYLAGVRLAQILNQNLK
jgi:hypothetical protein